MLLGTKNLDPNNVQRVTVDYRNFLQDGTHVKSAAVSSSSTTSTVAQESLSVSQTCVFFYVTAGPNVETFTVTVVMQDNIGQTVNDTITFNVL